LKKKKSLRWIANYLDRSVSSISGEVKDNSVRGIYNAVKAEQKAYLKRYRSKKDCMKVAMNIELKNYVTENIKEEQSPEGISGRLKNVLKKIEYASSKAIYKFIESVHGRQIEKFLYSNMVRKKGGLKKGKSVVMKDRTFIDERPRKVEKRLEFGHFEADFIESGKDGKGSLLVIVERKSRYPFLCYLENRKTKNVNDLISNILKDISIKSLTIDNDISFQKHKELSKLIDSPIFFCHPHAPYQKGTVENRNKLIRKYIKKKSDLSVFPLEYFKMVEDKLRNKFMERLNFKTPKEVFENEMLKENLKLKLKKPLTCGIIKERLLTS
jgi:IS30 family transposase